MRLYVILTGLAIIALGVMAQRLLERAEAAAFLLGALTLGGGMIIAGLFALKMRWHGVVAAGVLGLLGAARGLANASDWVELMAGRNARGAASALELGVTMLSVLVLLRVLRELRRERVRRMLEQED